MTLLNGSDMHICTFLHILMFLLASSQQMLEPEHSNRIARGLPKQLDAAASIGYVKWIVEDGV